MRRTSSLILCLLMVATALAVAVPVTADSDDPGLVDDPGPRQVSLRVRTWLILTDANPLPDCR